MVRPRRYKSILIMANARTKEGAMRTLNEIMWKSGCSSLGILKVLIDKIKSFS